MSKDTYTPDAAAIAEILSRTLALAQEAGLIVGVRNATANEKRPDGLLIFVAGLHTDGTGGVFAVAPQVTTNEVTP